MPCVDQLGDEAAAGQIWIESNQSLNLCVGKK